MPIPPFVLFTDYGWKGPYVGLLHAAIQRESMSARIIDLQHDLPSFRPRGAGILLASQLRWLPPGSSVIAVVDPGVGTSRQGLVVEYAGYTLIGPDNGLFAPFLSDADRLRVIDWLPDGMSPTFHGRDWFAPVATRLAAGDEVATHEVAPEQCVGFDWAGLLPEVIYADGFGNLMTGIPEGTLQQDDVLRLKGQQLHYAGSFGRVPVGTLFWHINSLGLVELAVNQGSAADVLGLGVGDLL